MNPLKGQPRWVILLAIGAFSGFSFVVLYSLSKEIKR